MGQKANRSKRLRPVAEVAQRREQDAARVLKESRDTLRQYETQLENLKAYRQEYVLGFQQASVSGMGAGRMKDYLVFLSKLDDAINQLEAVMATTREDYERDRTQWVAKRARLKALDEVIARFRMEERRDEIRREQRDTDERAQRKRG